MKAIVLVLLVLAVSADQDFFHFRHGCIVNKRIRLVRRQTRIIEQKIRATRSLERKILRELELDYDDTGIVTRQKDKVLLQERIATLQRQLVQTRIARRFLLAKLRRVADRLSGAERRRIIRKNKLEEYLDFKTNDIAAEYKKLNEEVFNMEKEQGVEYAKKAAKRAAQYLYAKLSQEKNMKKAENQRKAKKEVEEKAKEEYKEMYNSVVRIIRKELISGQEIERIRSSIKAKLAVLDKTNEVHYAELTGKLKAQIEATKSIPELAKVKESKK